MSKSIPATLISGDCFGPEIVDAAVQMPVPVLVSR
jgi:hypothetical protein